MVEDDPSVAALIALTLEDHGFKVSSAIHGADALDLVDHEHVTPDVVVLDLEMPVMDGRCFFREFRRRDAVTPVLVLSAYGARRARSELGADDALDKPFEPDALVERLRVLIGSRADATAAG